MNEQARAVFGWDRDFWLSRNQKTEPLTRLSFLRPFRTLVPRPGGTAEDASMILTLALSRVFPPRSFLTQQASAFSFEPPRPSFRVEQADN